MVPPIRTISISWPEAVALRVRAALAAATRRRRTSAPHPGWATIALLGVAFAVAFVLLVAFADAPAIIWARSLPREVVGAFRAITDLGKAAWFLYPLPALMIVLVLLPVRLPRAAQATFTAMFARIAFLFF